jgi:glycosyltransferase involved in cell wall biosynthesis
MVANLIAYKGHADLLAALTMLESRPVIRLIGEGPERHQLEREIRRLELSDVVQLEGHLPQAAEIFREVQFALLTSHHEGLPNALLEAMAAGLPVIATAVGGVPELVDHEKTGLLVPPSDPVALAQAIAIMSSDTERRVEYGRAARAKALRYSWERCREAHLSVYEELLRA